MSWTQARIDTMISLAKLGRTAGQIARELGSITRDAVIGKFWRLGISLGELNGHSSRSGGRAACKSRQCKPKPKRKRGNVTSRPEPNTPLSPEERAKRAETKRQRKMMLTLVQNAQEPNTGGVLFLEAERKQCRWIAADPKKVPASELRCCGEPVVEGHSWCAWHLGKVMGVGTVSERRAHEALGRAA